MEAFRTISIFSIPADEPLPFRLAIFFKGRHLVYRYPGQSFESEFYDKFVFKRLHRIFVPESDYPKYLEFVEKKKKEEEQKWQDPSVPSELRVIHKMMGDLKKSTQNLFAVDDEEKLSEDVQLALDSCKDAVETIAGKPYIQAYTALSYKANTIADHSMRVSVLATFLGYQLGFVNPVALEHLAAAALLHDIGKTKVGLKSDEKSSEDDVQSTEDFEQLTAIDDEMMRLHPEVSCEMLARIPFVPQEVIRIIREHHEARDGSGYPTGMRGPKMYGLSKVFQIANTFDQLSSSQKGDRSERYLNAAKIMTSDMRNQFDTNLLPKAVRLLTHSLKT